MLLLVIFITRDPLDISVATLTSRSSCHGLAICLSRLQKLKIKIKNQWRGHVLFTCWFLFVLMWQSCHEMIKEKTNLRHLKHYWMLPIPWQVGRVKEKILRNVIYLEIQKLRDKPFTNFSPSLHASALVTKLCFILALKVIGFWLVGLFCFVS